MLKNSRDNSANRSVTDALNATRNYINKLMKNNRGGGEKHDYTSSFERKGIGFSKAERNRNGLVLEDTYEILLKNCKNLFIKIDLQALLIIFLHIKEFWEQRKA